MQSWSTPNEKLKLERKVELANSLVCSPEDSSTTVVLTNNLGFSQWLEEGAEVGTGELVEVIDPLVVQLEGEEEEQAGVVGVVVGGDEVDSAVVGEEGDMVPWQKQAVKEVFAGEIEGSVLTGEEKDQLLGLLQEFHDVFSLEKGERGETNLLELHIKTGEAEPRKQPVRRVPFAVRKEIARHLKQMQEHEVIQPSNSPWASPIVLVRKKDGTLRFCVDYRGLNSVTKSDKFPLPRIDDLLDQLGRSRYFTTLDLAAGYWQIRVDEESREKTAFVTHEGLFEFRVMPFGLMNAPSVFQRLMQKVLNDLNPTDGKRFVSVYIDDVLIFSETLEDHLEHLRLVFGRLGSACLKLKPSKCHFI